MLILENKIIKYKNINILKEKTDKNFNLYSLINNKNELLNYPYSFEAFRAPPI